MPFIYKICSAREWDEAVRLGTYLGSAADLRDGFIHFSTAGQVAETAAKYFAGMADLVLVQFCAGDFGAALKWEPARNGALFPHLHAPLPVDAARRVKPLPVDGNGRHVFPDLA